MKKIFFTLLLCSVILISGCNKKSDSNKIPKSLEIYQQLNLTNEQEQKLTKIRDTQRIKMDEFRTKMEDKRKSLISFEAVKNLSEEKKQENFSKFREASKNIREEMTKARTDYDNKFMDILDDNQKKIYKKYLTQREKEKQQRIKDLEKSAK